MKRFVYTKNLFFHYILCLKSLGSPINSGFLKNENFSIYEKRCNKIFFVFVHNVVEDEMHVMHHMRNTHDLQKQDEGRATDSGAFDIFFRP